MDHNVQKCADKPQPCRALVMAVKMYCDRGILLQVTLTPLNLPGNRKRPDISCAKLWVQKLSFPILFVVHFMKKPRQWSPVMYTLYIDNVKVKMTSNWSLKL